MHLVSITDLAAATDLFTADDVERGRAYHRPLYVALSVDVVLVLGLTSFAAFGWPATRTWATWWAWVGLVTVCYLAALEAVRLPLAVWRWRRDVRWGLSTQAFGAWLADRAKGLGVAWALTAGGFLLLLGCVRVVGGWWPAVAAPGAALIALALTFLAPLVLEPLFNRFRPLQDERADALRALAVRAGVPVRDVLVADASRRTRRTNAYVSGLGRTRRVVLYDTLLDSARQDELEVVVAHELGHRAHRDVAKGTALAMAFAAAVVLVLWPLDPSAPHLTRLLLASTLLELAAVPLFAAWSRRAERAADRFALDVTHDADAFRRAFVRLSETNVADLDPPRLVYALLFTHPTPVERVAATIG